MNKGNLELAIQYFKKVSKNYKDEDVQKYIVTAQRDLFVDQCRNIPYSQMEKNADNYSGEKVHFYGKIYNIQEIEGKTLISLSTKQTLGDYIGDEVFVVFPKSIDNVEGDLIDIW
jgi:hypothetical protein